MIGHNDKLVVLEKEDHNLVAVPIEKLSKQDQAFLQSKEGQEAHRAGIDQMQTWTTRRGMKINAKILEYGRRDMTIQRRRGKIFVNDHLFDNMPLVKQTMVPQIIEHFEKTKIDGKKGLEEWILKLKGEPKTYTLDGVMMELENGDEYGVPFFFFSDEDQKILKPGWDRWLAGDKQREKQEHESFMLQQQAQAYQKDRQVSQQISMMQLQMTGYEAGLFDLWEVQLFPGPNVPKQPLCVVVPARDSRQAAMTAMQRNPGYQAGAAAKVRRKSQQLSSPQIGKWASASLCRPAAIARLPRRRQAATGPPGAGPLPIQPDRGPDRGSAVYVDFARQSESTG